MLMWELRADSRLFQVPSLNALSLRPAAVVTRQASKDSSDVHASVVVVAGAVVVGASVGAGAAVVSGAEVVVVGAAVVAAASVVAGGAVVAGVTVSEPPPHPEATNRTAKRVLKRVMDPV